MKVDLAVVRMLGRVELIGKKGCDAGDSGWRGGLGRSEREGAA